MGLDALNIELRESTGVEGLKRVFYNLSTAQLVEEAIRRGEGQLTSSGALTAFTGSRTGRSPNDKFMVDYPEIHDEIWWGKTNQPITADRFDRLRERMVAALHGREVFVFDGCSGADPAYSVPIRVVSQHAWQSLFARQLFRRDPPRPNAAASRFTVLHVPDFLADPSRDGVNSEAFVLVDLIRRLILIGGTQYAGEVKKAIFGVMNFLLPDEGVFPMHCSANVGPDGDTALFFGLSGTGKTTLSADPARRLIGDDEHGWSPSGVFNLEGGCYAKCIRLSEKGEPQIWNSIRFGAVLENVTLHPDTRDPDYDDDSVTENTRAAFPIEFIPHAIPSGRGGHPRNILFLSYDAFGVLPPLARLTPEQAMYHFLSGYTSKTAGTEAGAGSEPRPDFSACFAQPFLPRPPETYASMLGQRLREHGAACWLLNTGYTGGPFGVGRRLDLQISRALVNATLDGALEGVPFERDPNFGVMVPKACPGVPAELLTPRKTWADSGAYDRAAHRLAAQFHTNFSRFKGVGASITDKGAPPEGA